MRQFSEDKSKQTQNFDRKTKKSRGESNAASQRLAKIEGSANESRSIQRLKNLSESANIQSAARQPIVQRREISEIQAEIDQNLVAVSAIEELDPSQAHSAAEIIKLKNDIDAFKDTFDVLFEEAKTKYSVDTPRVSDLDARVSSITDRQGVLGDQIALAQGDPVPEPAAAWGKGGDSGPYLAYRAAYLSLDDNVSENQALGVEKQSLLGQRPAAVLKQDTIRVANKLAQLEASLRECQKWYYFYELMQRVPPVRTTYKDEGIWQNGASTLGVFLFSGPDKIDGIPGTGMLPVEVHIHFKRGSKQVNKAHVKNWPGHDIFSGNSNKQTYSAKCIDLCKATIQADEII